MKNKTALQTFIAWGDEMMRQEPMKLLSFAEAIDKAEELLEMEKEQIMDSQMDMFNHINQNKFGLDYLNKRDAAEEYAEQYYKETYEN